MQRIINHIYSCLLKKALTIAVAESCTGGLLSKTLTDLAGSSAYFVLGIVAYSDCAKKSILKIPAKIISEKGAVSQGVACRMAEGIRRIARTDIGIGITGIAGPSGGTAAKPVGTVFIAIDSRGKTVSKKFRFRGTRATIRKQATFKALELCAHLLP